MLLRRAALLVAAFAFLTTPGAARAQEAGGPEVDDGGRTAPPPRLTAREVTGSGQFLAGLQAARVSSITDAAAWAALTAERALVEALGGGCQTPIGALASPDGVDGLDLLATVVSLDGTRVVYGSARGTRAEAAALGAHVAGQLLNDGAGDILEEVRRGQ